MNTLLETFAIITAFIYGIFVLTSIYPLGILFITSSIVALLIKMTEIKNDFYNQ